MLVIPKEPPLIANLNTYYLDVRRLIEHYQGEIGAGGVCFKSSAASGILFFDHDEILNGCFKERHRELIGDEAIDKMMDNVVKYNHAVSIYAIPVEEVYFWASLTTAEIIYRDLSTEFTDLEGLIKKMQIEKLTGFIDVAIQKESEGGLVFISYGEIIGGSYSLAPTEGESNKFRLQWLLKKTKEMGGVFNVSKIPILSTAEGSRGYIDAIKMNEEFIGVFETLCTSMKIKNLDFNSLLKKKFVEIADRYPFLDPFAAEFDYKDRKVSFTGDASDQQLTEGVFSAVKELAGDLGLLAELNNYLSNWKKKYGSVLSDYGLRF